MAAPSPKQVVCARSPSPRYGPHPPEPAAELPRGVADDVALVTLRRLLCEAGLDRDRFGQRSWNPLGDVIAPGSRVVVKPNWVLHAHPNGLGLDCLVTHTSVLSAILHYVCKARPAQIVIGDAPIQGCDFAALRAEAGLDQLADQCAAEGIHAVVADLRRKILLGKLGDPVVRSARGDDEYVVFDLAGASALEPVSDGDPEFRVTMYPPDALQRTHRKGHHEYLVAREIVEADIVVNVPKLKTHMKSGVTGALKNMVGMNGLKDYLPHHRKGGSRQGGDCYHGHSYLKRVAEEVLDLANRTGLLPLRRALGRSAAGMLRLAQLTGADRNLEGSWYGNDTVWRMCLDLQRILYYGAINGTLQPAPQRTVLTITDAIVAGEGQGPLTPTPVSLGLLTLALNTAAAEQVHTLLMGFDPSRVPIVREAFAPHPYPLASFGPDEVRVVLDGQEMLATDLPANVVVPFRAPDHWRGHCERRVARAG